MKFLYQLRAAQTRDISVQHNTIVNTVQKEESSNFIQTMLLQKTTHSSPIGVSYWASFVRSLEKKYRKILSTLYWLFCLVVFMQNRNPPHYIFSMNLTYAIKILYLYS